MRKSFCFFGCFVWVTLSALSSAIGAESVLTAAQTLGSMENFPRFMVPGKEKEMAALNAMHRLHYPPVWLDYPHRDPQGALCTLWDEWDIVWLQIVTDFGTCGACVLIVLWLCSLFCGCACWCVAVPGSRL